MAKSWKKLVQPTGPDSPKETGEAVSLDNIQLTLDEIAAQNDELNTLLRERQELENQMQSLLHAQKPEAEDPRFSAAVDSFKTKREQEAKRSKLKQKLEEKLARKNKEVSQQEEKRQLLKEKLNRQKKALKEQEAARWEQKRSRQKDHSEPERKKTIGDSTQSWFDTNFVRRKKAKEVERQSKVKTEKIRSQVKKVESFIKRPGKPKETDPFQMRDLQKLAARLNPSENNADKPVITDFLSSRKKKQSETDTFRERAPKKQEPERVFPAFNKPYRKKESEPVRLNSLRDTWAEKREQKQQELKEQLKLQRLAEKMEELKRFPAMPGMENQEAIRFPELTIPDLPGLSQKKDSQETSPEEREQKSKERSARKKDEQKDEERRNRMKHESRMQKKAERDEEERARRRKEKKKEKYA